MKDELRRVKALIEDSVRKNMSEGILLSGGLDTSIIAHEAARINPDIVAFTLAFDEALDLEYSIKLAEHLDLEHHILSTTEEDIFSNLKPTIKVLASFDPMEVRNSVAIYSILGYAKPYVGSVLTGDGGDEVFAGYSYLKDMSPQELAAYSRRLYSFMRFSSVELGESLGVSVRIPFIDETIKDFALGIDHDAKIRDGVGKWILRKAYESILPDGFAWRVKTPIEYGSGTTKLTSLIDSRIEDDEFARKEIECEKEGVLIRDKEHLFYYEIYKDVFGSVPCAKPSMVACSGCGAGLLPNSSYCRTCGEMNDEKNKQVINNEKT